MSGGHFDSTPFLLSEAACEMERLIAGNTDPEGRNLPHDIVARFSETAATLDRASAMLRRVDYLVSGDDGEDTFRERWAAEVGGSAESSPRLDRVDRGIMIRNALTYAIRGRRREPLWSVVADICGVGSTSGAAICRELGWDPDAEAGSPLPRG